MAKSNQNLEEIFYDHLINIEKKLTFIFNQLIDSKNKINYFKLRNYFVDIVIEEKNLKEFDYVIDNITSKGLEDEYGYLVQKYKSLITLKNNCFTFYEKRYFEEHGKICSHYYPLTSDDEKFATLEDEAVFEIFKMFHNSTLMPFSDFRSEVRLEIIRILKDITDMQDMEDNGLEILFIMAFCNYNRADSLEKTRNMINALESEENDLEYVVKDSFWQRIRKKFEVK